MLGWEVLTLESLHHPHIIKLFEVIEMWNRVYLVTEFISGGELYNKISMEGPLKELQAIQLFRQLLSAVKYMHSEGFVHRDIKAENVLLVNEYNVKLADFGFSTKLLKGPLEKLDTFCGSPPYAAPELFTEDHYIGGLVDIWALGVLLYFMVVGNMPFRAPTVPALRAAVLKGDYLLPNSLSQPCQRLIQRILVQNSSNRPTLDDLCDCQWLCLKECFFAENLKKGDQSRWQRLCNVFRIRSARRERCRRQSNNEERCPVLLLNCSTKRTESVLEKGFLSPVYLNEDGIPYDRLEKDSSTSNGNDKKAAKRSIFGGSSKKKIGPIEYPASAKTNKNSFDASNSTNTNNNTGVGNVLDNCVVDGVERSEVILSQEFEMLPTLNSLPDQPLNPIEVEALRILAHLGISREMLTNVVSSGARNELIGVYRIVVHRLQLHTTKARMNNQLQQQQKTKEDQKSGRAHNLSTPRKRSSSKCVVL